MNKFMSTVLLVLQIQAQEFLKKVVIQKKKNLVSIFVHVPDLQEMHLYFPQFSSCIKILMV